MERWKASSHSAWCCYTSGLKYFPLYSILTYSRRLRFSCLSSNSVYCILYNLSSQIATPDRIIIFDFLALGGVGSRNKNLSETKSAQLVQCSNFLLKHLFSANDIVKVGWSFSSSDLDMLRRAGGGEQGLSRIFEFCSALLLSRFR